MKYFRFNDTQIPLSCVTGLSYTKSGNIVPTSALSYKCNGIAPMQVQVQLTLNSSTCFSADGKYFIDLARTLSLIKPSKNDKPSYIVIGDHIIVPQMKFMLISTNITYQSDRLGKLQEMQISWTLAGSQVVKDENRDLELKSITDNPLPKVKLHCLGKVIDCSQDINIAELRLSGFSGHIDILLGDTYKDISRESWLVDVVNAEDSYFEIEKYGKFYISKGTMDADLNWAGFDLTKFSKSWYKNQTKTFIGNDKQFTLKDIFPSVEVSSKAKFSYLKYDDAPINMIYKLQDSLGYLIGLRNDTIYLYDTPSKIPSGQVTYDFFIDNDTLTTPISKVILRDGLNQYEAGDDTGETFFVNTECRVEEASAQNVLNYAKFNQNMIIMNIPLDTRIAIGSILNINTGENVVPCVVTEYDIDFLNNSITLELHYVNR